MNDKQIAKRTTKLIREDARLSTKLARYLVLDELFDDLPDGAYFSAMEEYGYETDDIIECNERANELGLYD